MRDLKTIETTPAHRKVLAMDRRIVKSLVAEFLAAGLYLSVDDGEEHHPVTRDPKAIFAAMIETDEDYLHVHASDQLSQSPEHLPVSLGWVRLIYGECGWDVMCDWTTNLDQFMPKTLALVDKLSGQ